MNEILNPQPVEAESEMVEAQPKVEEPQGEPVEEGGAPTAPQKVETHVPLSALEAERKARQDHKGRADRLEGELAALREQVGRPVTQPQQVDPLQSMQQQIINERFNTSEMLVRSQFQDADEKVNVFMEAARANPALAAALQTQRHPWKFAYDEGKRMLMQKEFGDDPSAYREKLKAELLAELQGSQPAPALKVPASINGARSVAPRSAPAFTGPTPLDEMFKR